MLKLKPFVDRLAKMIAAVSFIGIVIITLLTIVDVILSKAIKTPIPGSFEIVEKLMLVTVFSAFAYGQTQKTHINMTLLISRLPAKPRMTLFAIMSYLSVGISGILTYAAFVQMQNSIRMNYITAVLKIPFWPFYLAEGIAMVIFTLVLLYDAILSTIAIFRTNYMDIVTETWD